MSIRTVQKEIRLAMQARNMEDKEINFAEAKKIIKEAEKGSVTEGELNEIQKLVERGIVPSDGPQTEAIPELRGDSFYLAADAREALVDFLAANGAIDSGLQVVRDEIKAAKRVAPYQDSEISLIEAKRIIAAAEKYGVTKVELEEIAKVVEQGIAPETVFTNAIPELRGDDFYLPLAAKSALVNFLSQHGAPQRFTGEVMRIQGPAGYPSGAFMVLDQPVMFEGTSYDKIWLPGQYSNQVGQRLIAEGALEKQTSAAGINYLKFSEPFTVTLQPSVIE